MTRLEAALGALLRRLSALGVSYAVVGGLAVSARSEPRFTRDADVCVAVADDAAAEGVLRALQADGYRLQALVEQVAVGRIATARLVPQDGDDDDIVLDVLFASSGIEAEVVAEAEPLDLLEGLTAPVASVAALIALKVLARDDATRPQDRVDLAALLQVATDTDRRRARALLRLVEDRGYHRGRDLMALFTAVKAEVGGGTIR